MKYKAKQKALLVLEDGAIFYGHAAGYKGTATGEVCFNTGMTGYQEILTDPSYFKQIVNMTTPHIGNYGINEDDIESSSIKVAGFVIKEETINPSNWRSNGSLGEYLRKQRIVGIKNIDTRALTIHIRNNGAMNAIISTKDLEFDSLKNKLYFHPPMTGLDLVKDITIKKPYIWNKKNNSGTYKVAAIDFGIKFNILRILEDHGCKIKVYPANTSLEKIFDYNPDGVFLSNGPGDPAAVDYGISLVKRLLGVKPLFGICLGHQILALALGAKTFKLKFGHRGINHPVKNLQTGNIEITSQNHGFAVDLNSLPSSVISTHINLNDNTLAGIKCTDIPAFSVQYHPESSPGPKDSRYLFEKFIDLMKNA